MENNNGNRMVSQLFTLLGILFTACLLLSNLIARKVFALGPIELPASVILFPVTSILGDVFTEVYGFKKASGIIWSGFLSNAFAVLVYWATLALPAADHWTDQAAFVTVIGPSFRVFVASLLGYLFGSFSNAMVLSKLKVATEGKRLWVRTIVSTLVGEAFDTVIFIGVAFAGVSGMGPVDLLRMIFFEYVFKVLYEAVFTPVTYWVVRRVKQIEGVDAYDKDVSYNVFKLK